MKALFVVKVNRPQVEIKTTDKRVCKGCGGDIGPQAVYSCKHKSVFCNLKCLDRNGDKL